MGQCSGGGARGTRPFALRYARADLSARHKRTAVVRRSHSAPLLHPRPTPLSLSMFGYGTLESFLERNGLEEVGHMQSLGLR